MTKIWGELTWGEMTMGRDDSHSIKYYQVVHKTRKWWKTLFFHFIDVGTVNSFIIYKANGGELSQKILQKTTDKRTCPVKFTT